MKFQRDRELKTPYDESSDDLLNNPLFYQSLTQEENDDMENLVLKLNESQKFVSDHEHEISTLLSHSDWLDVYSKSVLDFGLDMDHFIHENSESAVEKKDDWKQLAEYAQYIKSIQ